MSDPDDEDLKLAIALSLQQPQPAAAELNESSRVNASPRMENGDMSSSSAHAGANSTFGLQDSQPASSVFSQLNRKAMEQERLARLAPRTRKKSISPPPLRRNDERPSKIRKLDVAGPGHAGEGGRPSTSLSNIDSTTQPQYCDGVVRRTWAFGHPRSNDIKIEEVLQSKTLRIAVLSAFQWDTDWLLTKTDATRTKFILVMQAKEEASQQQYLQETKDWPHVRLCFPPMPGQVSCMHSKLMLLFHGDYLRVVVPSANLVAYDWGETGVMENSVFLIDLPRMTENRRTKREELTSFGEELLYFIDAMGMEEEVKDGLLKFDFGKTKHLGFVHTIGGAHLGEERKRTGYPGLSRTVRALGLQTDEAIHVDYATSSVGSLNEGFLQTLYTATKGQEAGNSSNSGGGKRSKSDFFNKSSAAKIQPAEGVKDRFKVYFPAEDTVRQSTGGPDNGGTICLQSKWYDAATFPKKIMRDYQSTRKGLLSHNKIMYVRGDPQGKASAKKPIAWAYLGSANLSESAWGKIVTDRATKQPKLSARNWECGVLVPMPPEVIVGCERDGEMGAFKDKIPLPFEFPGQEYGTRRPWFFMG